MQDPLVQADESLAVAPAVLAVFPAGDDPARSNRPVQHVEAVEQHGDTARGHLGAEQDRPCMRFPVVFPDNLPAEGEFRPELVPAQTIRRASWRERAGPSEKSTGVAGSEK